jgi:predicted DNA-binding protein (MmcQ/YjbR family)
MHNNLYSTPPKTYQVSIEDQPVNAVWRYKRYLLWKYYQSYTAWTNTERYICFKKSDYSCTVATQTAEITSHYHSSSKYSRCKNGSHWLNIFQNKSITYLHLTNIFEPNKRVVKIYYISLFRRKQVSTLLQCKCTHYSGSNFRILKA